MIDLPQGCSHFFMGFSCQPPQKGVPAPMQVAHRPEPPQRGTVCSKVPPFSSHISHSTSSHPWSGIMASSGWLSPRVCRAAGGVMEPAGCNWLRESLSTSHTRLSLGSGSLNPAVYTQYPTEKKAGEQWQGRGVSGGRELKQGTSQPGSAPLPWFSLRQLFVSQGRQAILLLPVRGTCAAILVLRLNLMFWMQACRPWCQNNGPRYVYFVRPDIDWRKPVWNRYFTSVWKGFPWQ